MFRFFHIALPVVFLALILNSCAVTKAKYSPQKKFSSLQLKQDLDIAWATLKNNHPSYDLFTPADSIDAIFSRVKSSFKDSLDEAEFRLRLSSAIASLRCGHTSVSPSRAYTKFSRRHHSPQFPLPVKVWGPDSMVAIQSSPNDSLPIKRGTIITAIDSIPSSVFIDQMKQYISTDGYSDGYKEIQISSSFPSRFKWMYGLSGNYRISYIDSTGKNQSCIVAVKSAPPKDSLPKLEKADDKLQGEKNKRLAAYGRFKVIRDSATAILTLNNFSHPKVPVLIRSSFKKARKYEIKNLVVDLRLNGGGKIENSTLLTRYISDKPFKVADSVSAKKLKPMYPAYTQFGWLFRYFGWAIAKKASDGRWHMQKTERKVYKPLKKDHFSGELYVITSGFTFSASTLFLSKVNNQPNVTIVGEETGGGARGNSAVFTPMLTLPNTKARLRVPVFRIVTDVNIPANGRGIMPDVVVKPDSRSIKAGTDKKMEAVWQLILKKNASSNGY